MSRIRLNSLSNILILFRIAATAINASIFLILIRFARNEDSYYLATSFTFAILFLSIFDFGVSRKATFPHFETKHSTEREHFSTLVFFSLLSSIVGASVASFAFLIPRGSDIPIVLIFTSILYCTLDKFFELVNLWKSGMAEENRLLLYGIIRRLFFIFLFLITNQRFTSYEECFLFCFTLTSFSFLTIWFLLNKRLFVSLSLLKGANRSMFVSKSAWLHLFDQIRVFDLYLILIFGDPTTIIQYSVYSRFTNPIILVVSLINNTFFRNSLSLNLLKQISNSCLFFLIYFVWILYSLFLPFLNYAIFENTTTYAYGILTFVICANGANICVGQIVDTSLLSRGQGIDRLFQIKKWYCLVFACAILFFVYQGSTLTFLLLIQIFAYLSLNFYLMRK